MDICKTGSLAILILAAGCSATVQPISERGKLACREQAADLPPGTTIQTRQDAYRQCLGSIESILAKRDSAENLERQAETKLAEEKQRVQQQNWLPPQQRLSHCLLNRDNVIEAEKRRIRALGPKMMADQTASMPPAEKQRRLDTYSETIRELDLLLPERIRAGLPLIPDAVRVFSNCDTKSFSP